MPAAWLTVAVLAAAALGCSGLAAAAARFAIEYRLRSRLIDAITWSAIATAAAVLCLVCLYLTVQATARAV